MTGLLVLLAMAAAVGALNYLVAHHWSKLDHNPWAGKFWHGNFHGFGRPGWNPGKMTVEQIRKRGREDMTAIPIVYLVIIIAATVIVGLRMLIVGHL